MHRLWAAAPAALALLAAGCGRNDDKETQAVAPVEVATVVRGSIERVVQAEGILRAMDQAAVTPKIAAPVKQFLVNRGDAVKQGQLLAKLESRDLMAAVNDARHAYEQAAANYRNVARATVPDEVVKARADVEANREQMDAAKKLLESRQQLYNDGALARRAVDEARVAYAQAKALWETAQAHLASLQQHGQSAEVRGAREQMESYKAKWEAAQAQLSYAEIRSPVAGLIADRPLYAGEMAAPGTPLLTVVDASSVVARVNVAQEQAAVLKVGQSATLMVAGGLTAGGHVTVVSPTIDAQSTTVEVWVQAANPYRMLRPGATVGVEIKAGTVDGALIVAAAAILPGAEGGTNVLVVGGDNVARLRAVKIGVRNSAQAQILEGVAVGERVVVSGGVGLDDGAKVRVEAARAKDEAHE